jgi:glycosyltransferase involved in cell wall biosynthesis
MHILQVTPRFPPAIGGVEEHVYRISRELVRRGHFITVITSNEADGRALPLKRENVEGIRVYRSPLLMPTALSELWFMPKIPKILKQLRGDVVHAHGYRCLSSFEAICISHARDIPAVLTPHGIYPPRSFINGLAKSFFDKSSGRLLLGFSDRVIALSEHNRLLLSQLGVPQEKMVLVPNGVNIQEYMGLHRSQSILRQLHTDGPILLYVGRIDWNKRVDRIVEALPAILRHFPSAKLVVVGPDYADSVSGLINASRRHNVESSLVVTGNVTKQRLLEFYSVADVFILPSSYEGFGLSMLEAMCSGVPVVVSSSGGPGDILSGGTHALLLKECSPNEISGSVCALLTDCALRERLVKNAFELVKTKYTWESVVDKLERTYQQVLQERGSQS